MLRHRQLSDVVQHRRRFQRLGLVLGQAQFLCQFHGVDTHALQVLAGGFVFCLNGQRQRFDRPQVQA